MCIIMTIAAVTIMTTFMIIVMEAMMVIIVIIIMVIAMTIAMIIIMIIIMVAIMIIVYWNIVGSGTRARSCNIAVVRGDADDHRRPGRPGRLDP